MALQTRLIDIPLGGGVQQQAHAPLVDPPGVIACVDMDPSKAGGYVQRRAPDVHNFSQAKGRTLIARTGSDLIATGGIRATGDVVCGAELYAPLIGTALTYDAGAAARNFSALSTSAFPVVSEIGLNNESVSVAYAAGLFAVIHCPQGTEDSFVVIMDQTGAVLSRQTLDDSSDGARIVSDGTVIYAVWESDAAATVYGQAYTPSTQTWAAKAAITGLGFTDFRDVIYLSTIGIILLGTTAGNVMRVAVCTTGLTVAAATSAGLADNAALAIYAEGTSISVVGKATAPSTVRYQSFSWSAPSTLNTTASGSLLWNVSATQVPIRVTIAGGTDATTVVVFIQSGGFGAEVYDSQYRTVTVATGVWSGGAFAPDLVIAHEGGMFGVVGVCLRNQHGASTFDPVVATVKFSGAGDRLEVISRLSAGYADQDAENHLVYTNQVSALISIGNGSYAYATMRRVNAQTVGVGKVDYTEGSALIKLTPRSYRHANASGTAYIAGGPGSIYDGEDFTDCGFAKAPQIVTAVDDVAGGSLSDGTYLVRFTWKWVDRNGNVHESQPSITSTVVVNGGGSSQSIVCEVRPIVFSARWTSVKLVGYRTLVGGSLFYQSTETDATGLFDTGLDYIDAIVGDESEATLATSRVLYTDSGEIDNYPPPPCDEMVLHANRVWCISGEDGSLWPSKLLTDGVAPGWNPALSIANPRKSRPVSLASVGDRLAVFYPDEIAFVWGDGPDNTLAGGAFSPVTLAHSGVGAISREVAQTSIGVVFQSRQGLMVLGAAGDVQALPQIEDVYKRDGLASRLLVGCCDSPVDNSILCGFTGGEVWLFNVRAKAWVKSSVAIDTLTLSYDVPGRAQLRNGIACIASGYESASECAFEFSNDSTASTYATCSLTTAWIKLAGIQGFQRVRRVWVMMEKPGVAGVDVAIRYDYTDTDIETFAFSLSNLSALAGYPKISLPIRPARQRCTSIAIKINNDEAGEGGGLNALKITGIRLEVGVLGKQLRNVAPAATG